MWEAGKIVGFWDPAKTRLNHMGFGLVLQERDEEEEEKKEQESGRPEEEK